MDIDTISSVEVCELIYLRLLVTMALCVTRFLFASHLVLLGARLVDAQLHWYPVTKHSVTLSLRLKKESALLAMIQDIKL